MRLGPFYIIRIISAYTYELDLPVAIWIHQVQPVSLLDLVVDDALVGQRVVSPPSVEVDGEEE
jgi:hypothetical protein